MKKNLLMLSLVAGSLSFVSCGEKKENKNEGSEPMQNEMHQEDGMDHNEKEMSNYEGEDLQAEFKDEATAKSYALYVEVKDALVNTDAEMAKEKAGELVEVLEENQSESIAAAKEIAESDDVNMQREVFSKLTASMESVLEGALASGEIYKQFCPMAFEGKGDYWYSNSKEIFNPYYGDKMLKCGRVDATIN